MLKQALLIGAAAISFPALAQTTDPMADPAAAPAQAESAPATEPVAEPAPDTAAPAPAAPATAEPAPASGAAATPVQIAQIVGQEFKTYDADANGQLSDAEFGSWMKKLRTANDPSIDPESEDVKTWIGQAFAAADADKSGGVSQEELTGFLSRGA